MNSLSDVGILHGLDEEEEEVVVSFSFIPVSVASTSVNALIFVNINWY